MTGWNASNSAGGDPGAVTILEGSTFCVSAASGDMSPDFSHGWFFRDTRMLSRFNVRVDGARPEPLDSYTPASYRGVFIGRLPHPAGRESDLIIERDRTVGAQLVESVTVRNYSHEARTCTIHVRVDTDFADLFEVKRGVHGRVGDLHRGGDGETHWLEVDTSSGTHRVAVMCPGGRCDGDGLEVELSVPAKGAASATFRVTPSWSPGGSGSPVEQEERMEYQRRDRRAWVQGLPGLQSDDEDIQSMLRRSMTDLGALRIEDPAKLGRMVVAAGAPWFMTLFGRDSILSALMALPVDRSLALGTLQTLADRQGSDFVPATDEEPGRILHEVRHGREAVAALGGSGIYYGTADATPLFVHLAGELHRWGGLPANELDRLLPHLDRAMQWALDWGDRDGDGFVEYARHSEHGLVNQGWKDSWDGISFADGTIATGPIALAEVQGYVYRAWLDRARLARAVSDDRRASECEERAAELKEAFNRRFWLDDRGWYALALDGGKRPVDALASNMGHCLWTGIVDTDKAGAVAEHLLSPAMFSGWGVRTLALGMGAFNPVSYHNGSVWPHDNAIIAHGLMRYGFVEEASRVAMAVLEAAVHFRGRLPELYCGFSRELHPEPIAYPTSCSPQAWAAATPLHLLRVLLRLEPDLPARHVRLAPALPQALGGLRITGLPLGGGSLTFSARGQEMFVESSPPALHLSRDGLQ